MKAAPDHELAVPCPVCGQATRARLDGLYDDRHGYSGSFTLHGCAACGHRHIHAAFEPRHLGRLYTQFYPRAELKLEDFKGYTEVGRWPAWWKGERSAAFRWVPRGVRVLDVGCGFGQTLAYHRGRGCEVYGCEADENIRRVAERFGFNVHVGVFDPEVYAPGFFDYVTLDQVIEHSTDPVKLLKGVTKVLKPGALAILSTPNPEGLLARLLGRFWMNLHVPYHLQFFTRRSMLAAAAQAGLKLERIESITSSAWIGYQGWHLLSRPPIGVQSPFWNGRVMQRLTLRRMGRAITLLQKIGLDSLATRLIDALSLGDNRLYFLRKSGD